MFWQMCPDVDVYVLIVNGKPEEDDSPATCKTLEASTLSWLPQSIPVFKINIQMSSGKESDGNELSGLHEGM